jgi:hypothetical protein
VLAVVVAVTVSPLKMAVVGSGASVSALAVGAVHRASTDVDALPFGDVAVAGAVALTVTEAL